MFWNRRALREEEERHVVTGRAIRSDAPRPGGGNRVDDVLTHWAVAPRCRAVDAGCPRVRRRRHGRSRVGVRVQPMDSAQPGHESFCALGCLYRLRPGHRADDPLRRQRQRHRVERYVVVERLDVDPAQPGHEPCATLWRRPCL